MTAKLAIKATVFALFAHATILASAATLSPGDIVVASLGESSTNGDGAIFKVDPTTGDRIIISGPGVGAGPGFESYGVSVATVDDLYFVDGLSAIPAVYHVDVATGNRQVIASPTTGTGPVIQSPFDIVVRSDGKLIVSDGLSGVLVLIDPVTLERSVVSGPGVGTGPDFYAPAGLSLDSQGEIFVTTANTDDRATALFKVNAMTGDRELISAIDIGGGPGPDLWPDVAIDETGQPLVTNFGGASPTPAVLSVDLTTGDRTIVSSSGIGIGPALFQPAGIGIESDGKYFSCRHCVFQRRCTPSH